MILAMAGLSGLVELKAATTVKFDTSDSGVIRSARFWSIHGTSVGKSVDNLGLGEIDAQRMGGVQEYALEADGSLSAEAKAEIDANFSKHFNQAPGVPIGPMASGAKDKVHDYYHNGDWIVPGRWRDMFKAEVAYITQVHHREIAYLEPLNEPDYGGKYGFKSNWDAILAAFKADPVLSRYPIVGPSTLDSGAASGWYSETRGHIDWGATHWINGTINNYANFLKQVRADDNLPYNSEIHNLSELIIGVQYGLSGGTFWNYVEPVEAKFILACQKGRQICYAKHDSSLTAVNGYKYEGKVYLFLGGSERHANDHVYQFICEDRDVYFDGNGPQHSYEVTVGKNGRLFVEVTWDGADLTPPGLPSGFRAMAGPGRVDLDWADNTDADILHYNVYRGRTPNGPDMVRIAEQVALSRYADFWGGDKGGWYYRVTAVDTQLNESGYSRAVWAVPTAGNATADDDFESLGLAGGTGWLDGWESTGAREPEFRTDNGNAALCLVGGARVVRALAEPVYHGVLRFKWDVDNLDTGESAIVEVFNGQWQTVWTGTQALNGPETKNSDSNVPDRLKAATIDLGGYGAVSQVRVENLGTGGWDVLFVDDLSIAAEGGLVNAALNKPTVTDSKYKDIYAGEQAVDGDFGYNDSRWVSANSGYPHWIEVDLLGRYAISRMNFWNGYNGYNDPPKAFVFQGWSDEDGWVDLFSQADNRDAVFSQRFPEMVTDKVRLYMTGGPENTNRVRLYELMVYGRGIFYASDLNQDHWVNQQDMKQMSREWRWLYDVTTLRDMAEHWLEK